MTDKEQKLQYIIDRLVDVKIDVLNLFLETYFKEIVEKVPDMGERLDASKDEVVFW